MKALKVFLASSFLVCGTQAFAQSTTTTTIEQHSPPAVIHEKEVEEVPVPVPVPVETPAPESHSSSSSSSSSILIKKSAVPASKQTTTRRVAYRTPRKHVSYSKTTSSCASKPAAEQVIEKHESHTESHDESGTNQ